MRSRTLGESFGIVVAAGLVVALAGLLCTPAYARTGILEHTALHTAAPVPSHVPQAAEAPAPENDPGTYQGMAPAATAITNDGRYAFVTFFLSEVVLKVRLADLTVEAKADLSQYFPLTSYRIVLDASERKIFVHSAPQNKILILDAQTLSVIHTIDNIPGPVNWTGGMFRSRHSGAILVWGGDSGTVKRIDPETYAVTDHTASFGFNRIQESPSDPSKWYVAAPGAPWTIGLYDHETGAWIHTVTIPLQGTAPELRVIHVLPNERKLYVGVVGGSYSDNHCYGWVYSVDLTTWQVKEMAVDGGAQSMAVTPDNQRLYVGVAQPALPTGANLQIVDIASDTLWGAIYLGSNKYSFAYGALPDIHIDPANPRLLYAISNDGNALIKIDLDTRSQVGVLVFNDETFRPHFFVKQPGQPAGYALITQSAKTFKLALDTATVSSVATLPGIPADGTPHATFTDAGRLLVSQGDTFFEIDPATMTVIGTHPLPQDTPSIMGFSLSNDQRWIYSAPQSPAPAGPNVFVAIDTATFTVQARVPLDGGVFEWRPFELPDGSKVYALGGFHNGAVTIHVIRTDNFTIQQTITFQDASLGQEGISAGPYYPYAYDTSSHTLFVGAANVVLAINTTNDTISKVIELRDTATAIGLEPNPGMFPWVNAIALVYQPEENCLYMTHLDRAYVSIYDLTNDRFLPRVIPLTGYFPWFAFANDACSKIYVLNTRADNISVIDVASKTEEKVINLHESLTVAPTITRHPASRDLAPGGTAMFGVEATGAPAYQWQGSTDGGSTWSPLADAPPCGGVASMTLTVTSATTALHGYQYRAVVTNSAGSATSNAATLSVEPTVTLQASRFELNLRWQTPDGHAGWGYPVKLTSESAYFYFFEPENLELMVKVLDGRPVNGCFWVFYGALTDLQFDLTIKDTVTGAVKVYSSPQGTQAGRSDINAFQDASGIDIPSSKGLVTAAQTESILLNSDRFQVEVDWATPGGSGKATGVKLTADSGYFWFFGPDNIELVLKILDARGVNGHFWVFYGALTDVQYTVKITDTQTGAVQLYQGQQGVQSSGHDLLAF